MQPMGVLQAGLPSPTAIPLDYCLCILDLKDVGVLFVCFVFCHSSSTKRQRKICSHFIITKSSGPWVPISLDGTAPRHG
jgi:hypothetical protein